MVIGGDGIGLKNLEQALARYIEIGVESGTATGGDNTHLDDTTKNWEVNRWAGGDIHVLKGGIEYVRSISANIATQVTFAALPGGINVAPGDLYSVRRITAPMDITDRWARQLGQIDLARVLGAALAHGNPVIMRLTDGAVFIDPRDVSDRAARLLGVIYGSQGQQLLQRAATFDLIAQLRHNGVEIDPRAIRQLTAADILTIQSLTQWGGVALTGRDISLDLKALTDDSIKGILKSIGDIAALENLINRIGQTTDAIVAAGAAGSISAKLRRATQGLEDLKTLIMLGQLTPLQKANEHNTAETANTDILAAALSPTNTPCLFRVMVAFDTAGIFRATITKAGNTQTVAFNSGSNLAANALYIYDHLVHSGDTVNYRYSVNAQLLVLRVQEIVAGVQ